MSHQRIFNREIIKKPKGWVRTHKLNAFELGLDEIVREWTNRSSGKIIIITRYSVLGMGMGTRRGVKFGYNILKIDAKGNQHLGDEVYDKVSAIQLVYSIYMRD